MKPHWSTYFRSNYYDGRETCGISDELIDRARPFEGYTPEFLEWPAEHWDNWAKRVPCLDPEKNAFHIRMIAEAMRDAGEWFKESLRLFSDDGQVEDGNHRLRAAQYLFTRLGVRLPAPKRISVYARGHEKLHPPLKRGTPETLISLHLSKQRSTLHVAGETLAEWLSQETADAGPNRASSVSGH